MLYIRYSMHCHSVPSESEIVLDAMKISLDSAGTDSPIPVPASERNAMWSVINSITNENLMSRIIEKLI